MANRFLNNITINDSYTLPSADGTADQLMKTDGSGQLGFMNQSDITAGAADTASLADKALSLTITVKNTESVALTKGQVVCAAPSATPPSGNVIEVKLADNDGTDSMPAIGVLNEGLDAAGGANDEGEAIMFGRISGINTSAFSVGDEVFVSDTAGALTATKPTGVKYIQKIGVVIRDDATNGTIEIFGAGRTNDVPTPLYIDHTNQRVGIGVESPSEELHISSESPGIRLQDSDGTNTLGRVHYSGGSLYFYSRNNTNNGNFIWVGIDGTTSTEFMRINSSGNVGIGTTNPTRPLHINGAGTNFVAEFQSTDDKASILIQDDDTLNYIHSQDGYLSLGGQNALSADNLNINSSNGNVGIGTTSPSYKLSVTGGDFGVTNGNKIYVGGATGDSVIGYLGNDSGVMELMTDSTRDFKIGGGTGGTTMFFDTSAGNVGIGTTSPSTKLDVRKALGTGQIDYSNSTLRLVDTSTGLNAGQGAAISLSGVYNSNGNLLSGAPYIRAAKENSTSGDYGFGLQFGVRENGSSTPTTEMVINSSGNVGIGTTSPGYKLDVKSGGVSTYVAHFTSSDGASLGGMYEDASTHGEFYVKNSSGSTNVLLNSSGISYLNGGDVGLRTTSPSANLHIKGASNSYASVIIQDNVDSGYSGSSITFLNQNSVEFGHLDVVSNPAGSYTDLAHQPNSAASSSRLKLYNGYLGLETAGSERMRIDSSGNVGIGTTSPAQKLDVDGNIKMTETAATVDTDKFVVSDSGVLKYRTGAQVLSDIGAAASSHNHDGSYIKDGGTTAISDINAIGTESIKHRWNSSTTGRPASGQSNEYGTVTTLTYDSTYATQIAWDIDQGNLYSRTLNLSTDAGTWVKFWHTGNDGSGSGLDADTLDGSHASAFATASHNHDSAYVNVTGDTMTGNLNMSGNQIVDARIGFHNLGSTQGAGPAYNYKYYRITNDLTFDNNRIYELLIDADDNAGYSAIYHIYISQHNNTGNNDRVRFHYVSGDHDLGELLVATDEHVWVRSTAKWGTIRIRAIYENEDVSSMPFATTETRPTTQASGTSDFEWNGDNNTFTDQEQWHAGNDGSGSGLDADTLDGSHASAFATASHNHDSTYVNVTGDTMTGLLIAENGIRIGSGDHYTDGRASLTFGEGSPTGDSMYIEYDGENLSGDNNAIFIGSNKSGVGDVFSVTYGGSVLLGSTYTQPGGSSWTTSNSQLILGGAHNAEFNDDNPGVKLLITGYNNDGTTLYPIYVEDENGNVDFWLKNRPSGTGTPTAYFAGNVGIGRTSPSEKLEVAGNIVQYPPTGTGGYLKLGQNVGANDVAIELGEGRTANGVSRIDFIGDTTYTDYGFRAIRHNSGANAASQLVHRGTGNFELVSQDSGDIILNPNSGNVGIGTTSPSYKLEVNGNAQFEDYIRITNSGGGQRILFGNQDSSGANNPSVILGANGNTYIGGGNSWTGNGGTVDYTATFSDNGSVGIGTTAPSQKLDVAGNIKHTGLTMTEGTDVDQVKIFTMTYQLDADTWTDTGISAGDLSTGTYIMQVYADDNGAGGQHYNEYYSATISWYGAGTNSAVVDEIVVHRAGHAPNSNDLQFRTQRHDTGGDDLMLQVKANIAHTAAMNNTDNKKHTYKFRRLI